MIAPKLIATEKAIRLHVTNLHLNALNPRVP
jgi:hypothetical protein